MSPEVRALTEVARCSSRCVPFQVGQERRRRPGNRAAITKIRWCGPGRCFPTSPSRQWPDAKAGVAMMKLARSTPTPSRPAGEPPLPLPGGEEAPIVEAGFPLPRRAGERWHAKRDGVGVDPLPLTRIASLAVLARLGIRPPTRGRLLPSHLASFAHSV